MQSFLVMKLIGCRPADVGFGRSVAFEFGGAGWILHYEFILYSFDLYITFPRRLAISESKSSWCRVATLFPFVSSEKHTTCRSFLPRCCLVRQQFDIQRSPNSSKCKLPNLSATSCICGLDDRSWCIMYCANLYKVNGYLPFFPSPSSFSVDVVDHGGNGTSPNIFKWVHSIILTSPYCRSWSISCCCSCCWWLIW